LPSRNPGRTLAIPLHLPRHPHVVNRDDPQAPPQVRSDIRRGRDHLAGGEHGVAGAAAPDLLLQDSGEIVNRNAVG
jgi:hypothetical protein